MAVDEALLSSFDPDRDRPVLRLYGWKPSAFSLGRFQEAEQVLDLARCRADGVDVVRRITGGGAIYHAGEITYSVVCSPRQIEAPSSVKESFQVLTGFLLRFYGKLGLSPRYAVDHYPAGTRLGERTPLCFAGRESCDILVDGRKIGGNAQKRMKNVIFQHGSIPLSGSLAAAAPYLRQDPAAIVSGTAALADFGISRPLEELKALLVEALCGTMATSVVPDGLSAAESSMAGTLMQY